MSVSCSRCPVGYEGKKYEQLMDIDGNVFIVKVYCFDGNDCREKYLSRN